MTTPYHRIGRNVRRLPAGYFGDCQITLPAGPLASATPNFGGPSTSAASENLERSEQSGAESREVSGESGAAVHFARHAAGVGHQVYTVATERIARGQQLRAARTVFGQPSTKPHVSR